MGIFLGLNEEFCLNLKIIKKDFFFLAINKSCVFLLYAKKFPSTIKILNLNHLSKMFLYFIRVYMQARVCVSITEF